MNPRAWPHAITCAQLVYGLILRGCCKGMHKRRRRPVNFSFSFLVQKVASLRTLSYCRHTVCRGPPVWLHEAS